jgi:hypothetical protein
VLFKLVGFVVSTHGGCGVKVDVWFEESTFYEYFTLTNIHFKGNVFIEYEHICGLWSAWLLI